MAQGQNSVLFIISLCCDLIYFYSTVHIYLYLFNFINFLPYGDLRAITHFPLVVSVAACPFPEITFYLGWFGGENSGG